MSHVGMVHQCTCCMLYVGMLHECYMLHVVCRHVDGARMLHVACYMSACCTNSAFIAYQVHIHPAHAACCALRVACCMLQPSIRTRKPWCMCIHMRTYKCALTGAGSCCSCVLPCCMVAMLHDCHVAWLPCSMVAMLSLIHI